MKSIRTCGEIENVSWNFVQENDLVVKNTMYNKRMKNRCTYKNKNTGHKGGKPWNATNYGQIDYIMIENRWKNSIFEAWSAPFTGIDSDHFPVIGRIKIKLAKKEKGWRKEKRNKKYDHWKTMREKPEKLNEMNEEVRRELQKLDKDETELGDRQMSFTEIINNAAENHILEKNKIRKESIFQMKRSTES